MNKHTHQEANGCDVLITYSWNRVGYNILRSLAAHGLRVWTADTSSRNICSMSKFVSGSVTYPDPFTHEQEFISVLNEHIERLKPKVLLPTHDEGVVIARNRHQLPSDLIIPLPSADVQLMLSDKHRATILAMEAGVPTPQIFNSPEEAEYPCVFKTTIGNSAKTVFYPENSEELRSLLDKYSDRDTFIEEFVRGCDYSVDCIRMNGHFYSSVYRALVTKTPRGGTTTQRIIVDEPALAEYARRLLEHRL